MKYYYYFFITNINNLWNKNYKRISFKSKKDLETQHYSQMNMDMN